jgi:hypothetical protein
MEETYYLGISYGKYLPEDEYYTESFFIEYEELEYEFKLKKISDISYEIIEPITISNDEKEEHLPGAVIYLFGFTSKYSCLVELNDDGMLNKCGNYQTLVLPWSQYEKLKNNNNKKKEIIDKLSVISNENIIKLLANLESIYGIDTEMIFDIL